MKHILRQQFLPLLFLCAFFTWTTANATPTLNLYNWSNSIHRELLQKFTEETGIKVNVDVYDNGDLMEVKMLLGNSGYDIVFVTASPYLERQAKLGVYQPLNKDKIPSFNSLQPRVMNALSQADPENAHAIPYLWGTTGFGVDKEKVLKLMPDAPLDSFALFFDPNVVSKISPCGVVLIDSPIEVFPAVLSYLGLDPNSSSEEDLKKATEVLLKVKPYIRKFQPIVTPHEIASGGACLLQGWSGDVYYAKSLIKEAGLPQEIDYHIAKEGGFIWIDAMAIPADAPHPELAYTFINFILRPENIAQVTNTFRAANAVPASDPYLEKEIRENPIIYPSLADMDKLHVDIIQSAQYERLRSREWTRVKTGR